MLRIYGKVTACYNNRMGLFGIQEDHIENYLSLDERFIKNKHSTFIFKMEGQSMEPYIYHGDYLIVDRALTGFFNKIVVVDYNGERLCRYLLREAEKIILRSFNGRFKDIVVTEEKDIEVFGVATMSFRDLVTTSY